MMKRTWKYFKICWSVAGDEEDDAVNVGEWCELLDQRVPRFDGFAGKLKGNFLLQVIKRKQRQDEKKIQYKKKNSGEEWKKW